MLYYLSQYLLTWSAGTEWADRLSALRLFRYITFRSAGAALTALILSWWLGPKVIAWLKRLKFGQEYADKAEAGGGMAARLLSKKGTPTMGGILIVVALNLTTLLWAQWNTLVQLTLLSVVVLTGLGFYDDYAKISQQSSGGARSCVKLGVQAALALFIGLYLWHVPSTRKLITEIMVPFYKYPVLTGAGLVGLGLTVLTIVGSSNAVNLTDGLDGLAIGCTLIVSFVFVVLTYLGGAPEGCRLICKSPTWRGRRTDRVLRGHDRRGPGVPLVQLPSRAGLHGRHGLAGAGRRARHRCGFDPSTAGAGDRGRGVRDGSGLGDSPDGLVSLHEVAVRDRSRASFLMAPIHHHFEKKGWYESQVVMRFYILGVLCAVVALSTLKIR